MSIASTTSLRRISSGTVCIFVPYTLPSEVVDAIDIVLDAIHAEKLDLAQGVNTIEYLTDRHRESVHHSPLRMQQAEQLLNNIVRVLSQYENVKALPQNTKDRSLLSFVKRLLRH
jgi:hypothetical protein